MTHQPLVTLRPWQIWGLAMRPKTLPAAMSGVIVGAALAWRAGHFQPLPALAALGVALLLQIGSNLANDVFDFERGADTAERLGPTRMTQAGLLSPMQIKTGMLVVFALAAALGLYLAAVSNWQVIWLGLAAILAAIAYTGGPYPLGYHGLGEVFVFAFFGPAAVVGTYYVQAGQTSPAAWAMSIPIGLLVTNILVVNNLRDLATDQTAGKRTLAVRFGAQGAKLEYLLCLLTAYLILPALIGLQLLPLTAGLAWGSLILAAPLARRVWTHSGRALNASLAGSGQVALLYSLLFLVGMFF